MINALRVMSFVALTAFLLAGCGREQSSDGGENPAATIVRIADQHDVGASDDHDHAAENPAAREQEVEHDHDGGMRDTGMEEDRL